MLKPWLKYNLKALPNNVSSGGKSEVHGPIHAINISATMM